MGIKYLLDTNVVLDFMAKNLPDKSQKIVAKHFKNLSIWNPWV